jgi:hypothetical protein
MSAFTPPGRLPEPWKPLRAKRDLSNDRKLIWVVQTPSQKYFSFPRTQINGLSLPSRPEQGAYHDRHLRGMGCGGRDSVVARFLRADERR